jgi:transcriptional regulator with XRE-family HTH domain
MSNEELGKALADARSARGLTLLDVERDTRISSKYLKALEAGKLEELPAPVYARAFMRTYAQYLGLNASSFVQRLPGARPEPDLPPLPDVAREAAPLLSASWIVAGVVVVLLLVFGLILFWNRGGDGEEAVTSGPPQVEEPSGEGGEVVEPPLGEQPAPVDVQQGVVPAVEEQHVLAAIVAVREAGLRYIVFEVENDDAPEKTVFSQSPSPGTRAEDSTVVTLLVSR